MSNGPIRRWPVSTATIGGSATCAWPADSAATTNNFAVTLPYSDLTFSVRETGASVAITASSIEGSHDGATWFVLSSNTLTPAAGATDVKVIAKHTDGRCKYMRLTLTSASSSTAEVFVIGGP